MSLISIIMPTYNAETFIKDAIDSVLAQSYTDWELLVVNDGSTDRTPEVVRGFSDPRIHLFNRPNGGIGSARNAAFEYMKGEVFCTFDSDDILPKESLRSRMKALQDDPDLDFVDGIVLVKDDSMERTLRVYEPTFVGEPLSELVALTGSCFFGPTWLVRKRGYQYSFNETVSHAEDLLFYLSISSGRKYGHVDAEVLHYRKSERSAMSDLRGLERSYLYLAEWIRRKPDLFTNDQATGFRSKVRRIMFGSFFAKGLYREALRSVVSPDRSLIKEA